MLDPKKPDKISPKADAIAKIRRFSDVDDFHVIVSNHDETKSYIAGDEVADFEDYDVSLVSQVLYGNHR